MNNRFHHQFDFLNWHLDCQNKRLDLYYSIENIGVVKEVLEFPEFPESVYNYRKNEIHRACELIHLMCGVSYYKSGMASHISLQKTPSQKVAQFIEKTWKNGLAELAFTNQISLKNKIRFNYETKNETAHSIGLGSHSLVALGGGKDSLVTVEELKKSGKSMSLFMVGNSSFIQNMAKYIGYPLIRVARTIDPKLIAFNKNGGINGHVPITAINSVIAVLVAILFDFNEIVFSNENSANEANTLNDEGDEVNHQYSKSYEFEKDLQNIIHNTIASDLKYYSQQRACSELAILKKFSNYPQYFHEFSSCNRNFHLQGSKNINSKWCCDCPKCRFVFLGLAPFIDRLELINIFGANMLNDKTQLSGFSELLGLEGIKPFECVGTIEESRLALNLIKNRAEWNNDKLVCLFRDICPETVEEKRRQIMSCVE